MQSIREDVAGCFCSLQRCLFSNVSDEYRRTNRVADRMGMHTMAWSVVISVRRIDLAPVSITKNQLRDINTPSYRCVLAAGYWQ
jgi:hypothetical protein